jgi:hypothetical protein
VPAILKGFFNRVFVRCLRPRFRRWLTDPAAHSRRRALGGEFDQGHSTVGDPIRRQIARGIKPLVSRKASFRMLTLYPKIAWIGGAVWRRKGTKARSGIAGWGCELRVDGAWGSAFRRRETPVELFSKCHDEVYKMCSADYFQSIWAPRKIFA